VCAVPRWTSSVVTREITLSRVTFSLRTICYGLAVPPRGFTIPRSPAVPESRFEDISKMRSFLPLPLRPLRARTLPAFNEPKSIIVVECVHRVRNIATKLRLRTIIKPKGKCREEKCTLAIITDNSHRIVVTRDSDEQC